MSISVAQAQIFFLVLTRILAMLVHVPVLGGQTIPAQVRIGLGLILAAVLIPWQPLPPDAPAIDTFGFGMAIGRELLIGTLAGFAAALTFGAVQIAAEAMGQASGLSAGNVLNPAMEISGSAMNQFFVMVAMLLFLAISGHHLVILAIQKTFTALPVNSPLPELNANHLLRLTSQMVIAGIQLALPVVGSLLLADITLGLLARVAPQIQVFFLGLPLKVGVGLIALSLTFSIALPALSDLFKKTGPMMLNLVGK